MPRQHDKEWHHLYSTSLWKRIRKKHLKGNKGQNGWCLSCLMNGHLNCDKINVDHIIPHKGDMDIFKDESMLQSLCEKCHLQKTRHENANRIYDYRHNRVILKSGRVIENAFKDKSKMFHD